ncbi:hypothetical protein [Streptomyces sp. NRRL B-24484]|uniref:hypothetical protein n=1 Tax=Streptomyces sp. NRRL B-24484 TaxID=1463833 RepID=UPI000AEE7BC0|nr:hypothetical protein [Streptomyces sp. NRRL B-24484]
MRGGTGLHGAFCLIRLLPLLGAVGSPLVPAVEGVVQALLAGSEMPDGVLIGLDDYRQAAGWHVGFDEPPVDFEERVCGMAILAAGVETRFGRPPLPAALDSAQYVWDELGTLAADLRAAEADRQQEDERVAAAAEDDPGPADRRLRQLRTAAEADRRVLERLVVDLGWRPTGRAVPARATGRPALPGRRSPAAWRTATSGRSRASARCCAASTAGLRSGGSCG